MVSLVHQVTGHVLSGIGWQMERPSWPGWQTTVRGGRLLVLVRPGFDPRDASRDWLVATAEDPRVDVVVRLDDTSPAGTPAKRRIRLPAVSLGEGGLPRVRYLQIAVPPAALQLELKLIDEHGAPAAGHRVSVRPADAAGQDAATARIELFETSRQQPDARPGWYRSGWRQWDRRFARYQVFVDGDPVEPGGVREIDYTNPITRKRVVLHDAQASDRRSQ
ncbi:MAG: hypothetical protein ACE37K_03805 [Planctomycetota bacterium]